MAIDAVDALSEESLGVRIALIAVALLCFGVGSAFYICASLGAGPRDSLMLVTSRRSRRQARRRAHRARARRARRRLSPRRHRRDRHARLRGRDRPRRRGLVLAAGAHAPGGSRSSIVRGMRAKGLIAAGGEATRLGELTRVVNKHLLPVGDWPMIFYPLQLLQLAGVEEVMIVTGQGHAGQLIDLLGNGRMSQRGSSDAALRPRSDLQGAGRGRRDRAGRRHGRELRRRATISSSAWATTSSSTRRRRRSAASSTATTARPCSSRRCPTRSASASSSTATVTGSSTWSRRPASSTCATTSPPSSDAVVGLYCYSPDVFDVDPRPRALVAGRARDHRRQPPLRRAAARWRATASRGWWEDAGTQESLRRDRRADPAHGRQQARMIDGLLRIPLRRFEDERGWFAEIRREIAAAEADAADEPLLLAARALSAASTTTSAARTTSSSACRAWRASSCSTARAVRPSRRTSATTTRSRSTFRAGTRTASRRSPISSSATTSPRSTTPPTRTSRGSAGPTRA